VEGFHLVAIVGLGLFRVGVTGHLAAVVLADPGLTFRDTAVSDEKREGLISLGFNTSTGAVINDFLALLRPMLEQMPARGTRSPSPATVLATGPGWRNAAIEARLRPHYPSAGPRGDRAVPACHAAAACARLPPRARVL
jgi:hypothetical protein